MVEAKREVLLPEQAIVRRKDGFELGDIPERGAGFFWRKFLRGIEALSAKGDPALVSPQSLDRSLWDTYRNLFPPSQYFDWAKEIRRQWEQNPTPSHSLADILRLSPEECPLFAYLPASVNEVTSGPYGTYALGINMGFGENGILRFADDELVAVDIVFLPVPDSFRSNFPQRSSAFLSGEIARQALSPPFIFNLRSLEKIDKDGFQRAIAGLLGLMIKVGWTDCRIEEMVLSGTVSPARYEQVPVAETIKTGGKPLYAGLLGREGFSSGSLRHSILEEDFPFSSTKVNWPNSLQNPKLSVIYTGGRRSFGVDDIGSAAELQRFVRTLHSQAVFRCLHEGRGCVDNYVYFQRAMDVPDELTCLSIACALKMSFGIINWRTSLPAKRDLVLPSLPELDSGS